MLICGQIIPKYLNLLLYEKYSFSLINITAVSIAVVVFPGGEKTQCFYLQVSIISSITTMDSKSKTSELIFNELQSIFNILSWQERVYSIVHIRISKRRKEYLAILLIHSFLDLDLVLHHNLASAANPSKVWRSKIPFLI